ncbi:MAG: terminase large subunit domain-containing protein [Solirubrobacteraceae bacterium]
MTQPALTVAEFADKVLKQPLWPHQVQLAESEKFVTACAAARRTGKSTLAQVMAAHAAFSYRNARVVILSAGQDSSRRMTEAIAAELNAHSLTRGAVVDDFSTRIRLSNGSEIVSLPASQRQVRGYGKGVRLVILDEAGFQPNEMWSATSYIAMDEKANGSRILLLGTPYGPADHFFRREYEAGLLSDDPDHASFHWTYRANPNLDHRYLERQRDRVSPASYANEVLGEWSSAIGCLFSPETLEACTADVVVPELAELGGPAAAITGCDWGASYDLSSVGMLWRLPVSSLNPDDEPRPRFIGFSYTWPAGTPLHRVVEEIVDTAAPHSRYMASETNGIGAAPSQDLVRLARESAGEQKRTWDMVNTTAASKTVAYSTLLNLMEKGQLVLPRHPDLLRQFLGIRIEQKERGFTSIAAESDAQHDDRTDALSLCMLPVKPARAHRWVSHTANLAAARVAPVDAAVPAVDCPTVATGSGLRLPQRPTLQSVAGTAYSLYAAPQDQRPQGVQVGKFFVHTNYKGVIHA